MKRTAALAVICAMLATGAAGAVPSLAGHASAASYVMSVGSSGSAVYQLQSDLKGLGYFTYPSITGYFGTVTRNAVIAFQRDYMLAADGYAGPITQQTIAHAMLKKRMMADAKSYLLTPYRWGGSDPVRGFDCSGFVYFMFTKFGVQQTRASSSNLFIQGIPVNKSMLREGDLVFFRNASSGAIDHVGFYLGDGNFISALSSKGVYIQSLNTYYWSARYSGARRIY